MHENNRINPISVSVTVDKSQEQAFELFVKEFSNWYPAAYTWSQDKLAAIQLGRAAGERCFERGPHHFEVDWGRMLTYQPPDCIIFSWQIDYNRQPVPDAEKASEVEVNFVPSEQQTTVKLKHRKFENHEENAAQYRNALASPEGWPFILEQFKSFANRN